MNKKEIRKSLVELANDITDNYDDYSDEDKHLVEAFLRHAMELNDSLEHYDKKKGRWASIREGFRNFFGLK